ncbi:MAG TPA: radical SAM family heme chaperone HemW [Candidatus Wunengus sp. YC60]|uniref:radical SAM family heme chaperone HemW n=1 Tax=Candidatus Wunengus sp. YC60 TaxID=3367697 RepID=UPI004027BA68
MLHNALYIHIPFCARKCRYCDFNSIVSESKTIDRYLCAIEKELCALKDRYIFNTVYIGGGTPSILTEVQMEKLLRNVIRYIPPSEIQEYTVEANPGTLTVDKIRVLKDHMVNRISLGVQSFQDRQLNFLGRIHSGNEARDAFALLRKAGFENINIDMIFGCPEQSHDDWEKDLKTAVELSPEHISTYALTYEEGTLLTRDLENKVIHTLDECVELKMYKTSIRYLKSNGYNHYEISNFAKEGYECAHNHVYWKNIGYVGVGAGAYSFVDGVRASNEKDIFKYIDGINESKYVKSFSENLELNKYASETVVMSLRLSQGISNNEFYERFGYKIEDQFGNQISSLAKDGLVSYKNEILKLTEKGLFVADTVMTEFI